MAQLVLTHQVNNSLHKAKIDFRQKDGQSQAQKALFCLFLAPQEPKMKTHYMRVTQKEKYEGAEGGDTWHRPLSFRQNFIYVGFNMILGWFTGPRLEMLKGWQSNTWMDWQTDFQLIDSTPPVRTIKSVLEAMHCTSLTRSPIKSCRRPLNPNFMARVYDRNTPLLLLARKAAKAIKIQSIRLKQEYYKYRATNCQDFSMIDFITSFFCTKCLTHVLICNMFCDVALTY